MTNSNHQSSVSNTDDCIGKIIEANNLEKSGQIEEAIAIYQEVLELDKGGNYGAVAEKALANLKVFDTSKSDIRNVAKSNASWWTKLSLKWKVIGTAIILSVLPIIGLGSAIYYVVAQSVEKQTGEIEQARAEELADKTKRFMWERYQNTKVIAQGDIFTNYTKEAISRTQKQAIIDEYVAFYPLFETVAYFDLDGNVIAKSSGSGIGNQKKQKYFQKIVNTGKSVISDPQFNKNVGDLVIFFAAPVIDKTSNQMIGVITTKMPVKELTEAIANFDKRGEEYHLVDATGKFFIALKPEQIGDTIEEHFPDLASITNTSETNAVVAFNEKEQQEQLVAYSPVKSPERMPPLNWEAVISVDTDIAFSLEKELLLTLKIGILATTLAVAAAAAYLFYKAITPILNYTKTVKQIGQGNLEERISIQGANDFSELGFSINLMADRIQQLIKAQEAESNKQRIEKEKLQTGVMNLLLDVEGAQKGDLTIQAAMSEGVIGSVADAFNTTISRLKGLVEQVQNVSTEVGQLSQAGESSVRQLSDAALNQAEEIDRALANMAEINESVEKVAQFAQEAAEVATQGLLQAQEGDTAMDMTVESIEKIRTTVAGTSKKAKQLAESSQEIAQIVEIIYGISEKTNLLAFNASVEAARAGEHGEGFRIVAEEVRRLADRITESTKDIQQLVSTIQQDTISVLEGMETSTTEVVKGSNLVHQTKQTLQGLAGTSEKIDQYLRSISTSTIEQTNNSQEINQKIIGIATIAKSNSTEAQEVVKSLNNLVQEAENLQSSVSKFKLKA